MFSYLSSKEETLLLSGFALFASPDTILPPDLLGLLIKPANGLGCDLFARESLVGAENVVLFCVELLARLLPKTFPWF